MLHNDDGNNNNNNNYGLQKDTIALTIILL